MRLKFYLETLKVAENKMGEKEKPNCYGYVLSNRDYQEKMGKVPVKDCAECEFLESCTAEYNDRVYNHYVDEYYNMTPEQIEEMERQDHEDLWFGDDEECL